MIIVRFEDSHGGQCRVILNDLVGGRTLQTEFFQSLGGRNSDLQRWSWLDGAKSRLVSTDVMFTAPRSPWTMDFPPDGGTGMEAQALWSWYPREEDSDELRFPVGAEVREVVDVSDDWSYGVYMGAGGLFPSPYVKKDRTGSMNGGVKPLDYVYNHPSKRESSWVDAIYDREPTSTSRANSFAVALFTFDSERASDLGFKKGDVITVTKKTDSTNDWWYVLVP